MDVQMSREESSAERLRFRFPVVPGSVGALLALILALAGCGGSTGAGNDGPVRSTMTPLNMEQKYAVDGKVDFSSFATVNSQAVTINDNSGAGAKVRTIDLRWVTDNDDHNLYIAMEWSDPTWNNTYSAGSSDYDEIRVLFDADGDGTFAKGSNDNVVGEDLRTLVVASVGSVYADQHRVFSDTGIDVATDLIGDGFGKLRYDAATQTYQAELLLPMSQDTNGQDGVLSSASRINFVIYDHVTSTSSNIGYVFGDTSVDSSTAAWPALDIKSGLLGYSYPQIPAGLTGLLAFVSEQEDTKGTGVGEIYIMDVATKRVTRITDLPDLYKNHVSLSPDRTQIAFEGVPCLLNQETVDLCRQRTDGYEIYLVNVDGSNGNNPTQLTSNALFDGHPSWSADNQRLLFTSFRNGGKGSLVIINTASGTEQADLTGAAGDDDRDPEFLPDGRIVFATNRFTNDPLHTAYETRAAVMNADGSGVLQLTSSAGVSDHQPVGDATKGIFERFTKSTDPETDGESRFVPWNLVEVQLNGASESTLLSDGWVNRQPVIDPSGKYVVYIKNNGYSAAYLMGRNRAQYGRLIPDITSIRSLDWK